MLGPVLPQIGQIERRFPHWREATGSGRVEQAPFLLLCCSVDPVASRGCHRAGHSRPGWYRRGVLDISGRHPLRLLLGSPRC